MHGLAYEQWDIGIVGSKHPPPIGVFPRQASPAAQVSRFVTHGLRQHRRHNPTPPSPPTAHLYRMPFNTPLIDWMVVAIEAAATVAFAVSGLLEAARKRLDPVGVCVVAGLAAFGGGTLRDVLLDRRPFFWVAHANWLWVLLGLSVAAMAWMKVRHVALTHRAMQWPDALGLGLFSATGTQLASVQGMPAIVAVLMGVITAVFGGVLRDIVCNEIPSAFADHQPYAVCAFVGGWTLLGLQTLGLPDGLALLAAAGITSGLRLWAMLSNHRLPGWTAERERRE